MARHQDAAARKDVAPSQIVAPQAAIPAHFRNKERTRYQERADEQKINQQNGKDGEVEKTFHAAHRPDTLSSWDQPAVLISSRAAWLGQGSTIVWTQRYPDHFMMSRAPFLLSRP